MPLECILFPAQPRKSRNIRRKQKRIRPALHAQRDRNRRPPGFQQTFNFPGPRLPGGVLRIDLQCESQSGARLFMSRTDKRAVRQTVIPVQAVEQFLRRAFQQSPAAQTEQHIPAEQRRNLSHDI